MFQNREDGARQLASKLQGREMSRPLILAIPRGGVITGAVLANELGAELDIVLARKLRVPGQPELAFGAISEEGISYINQEVLDKIEISDLDRDRECRFQLQEIERRKRLYRQTRSAASIVGRTIIVTDDGIATGSTMIAALESLTQADPREIIVAVPVASPEKIAEIRHWCDDVVCVEMPGNFMAVGQFYHNFEPVEDREVVELLNAHASKS